MSPKAVFFFITLVAVAASLILVYFNETYKREEVYYTFESNECIFPDFYKENKIKSNNKHINFFQNNFFLTEVCIINNSVDNLKAVELKSFFNGYYLISSDKSNALKFLDDEKIISMGDIKPKKRKCIKIWTIDELESENKEVLRIYANDTGKISIFPQICIYGGVYYWIIENMGFYQYFVAPTLIILVFLIGLLIGSWKSISIRF